MFFRRPFPLVRRPAFRSRREKSGSPFLPLLLFLTLAPALCMAQGTAFDLNGKSTDPLKSNAGKVVVLVFVRQDCPVSGRYAPVIQLASAQHPKDARFYLVF